MFINVLGNGYLCSFHFLTIMNNIAMIIPAEVVMNMCFQFSWVYTYEWQLLVHVIILCLVFWLTAKLFSKEAVQFTVPQVMCECSCFYTSSLTLVIVYLFFLFINHVIYLKTLFLPYTQKNQYWDLYYSKLFPPWFPWGSKYGLTLMAKWLQKNNLPYQ